MLFRVRYAFAPYSRHFCAAAGSSERAKFLAPALILLPFIPKYTASAPFFKAASRHTKSPAGDIISGLRGFLRFAI